MTVPFSEYIKNVASSEIYPTWSNSAIRANILAQISYALNRVYLEYYPSRGYDFDITNSTTIDQSFVYGRTIFENISNIVDDIFDNYIRREGFVEPLAAKYCNGTTSLCDGLSQWGSENLAARGYTSVDILKYYYGNNIELVVDTPVASPGESYPGTPLRLGSTGSSVETAQFMLNRIRKNFPLIPEIPQVDGVFGGYTEEAVRVFQQVFGLAVDGVIGRSTWYKMVQIYTGILRLAELNSQGQTFTESEFTEADVAYPGESGRKIEALQYLLNVLASYYPGIPSVPQVEADAQYFGPGTETSVLAAQRQFGLVQDGIVGEDTWYLIYGAYKGINQTSVT
ncbi:MAG: peptidoglycan-binding protein [Firmicutes bacterium]|nr:peptidoglycan-binding protein [Bacillota bacterium]